MIFGGFVQVPGTVIYIKTRKPLDVDFRVYALLLEQPTAFYYRRVDAIYCNSAS
ncbi:MAG: hypothetical protein NW226_14000 [Microscillaceae bacterium]|nr:hypothetical protein [Microscillaceae bacterium]